MPFKKIFCPNCGRETQVNDEKAFCFCLNCGKKITLKVESQTNSTEASMKEDKKSGSIEKSEINKKLEEVDFYYKLSQEKKESSDYNHQPTYYLKAQDILVDLSEQCPSDYRIWWELCKPIDFYDPLSATDLYDQYFINQDYFYKALDSADLSEKK